MYAWQENGSFLNIHNQSITHALLIGNCILLSVVKVSQNALERCSKKRSGAQNCHCPHRNPGPQLRNYKLYFIIFYDMAACMAVVYLTNVFKIYRNVKICACM